MKRILSQILLLTLWISIVIYGLSHGTPNWLQLVGVILVAVYLLGGSLYLFLRPKSMARQSGSHNGLPRRWPHWVFDEPVVKSKVSR